MASQHERQVRVSRSQVDGPRQFVKCMVAALGGAWCPKRGGMGAGDASSLAANEEHLPAASAPGNAVAAFIRLWPPLLSRKAAAAVTFPQLAVSSTGRRPLAPPLAPPAASVGQGARSAFVAGPRSLSPGRPGRGGASRILELPPADEASPIAALGRAPAFGAFGRAYLSPNDAALSPPLRSRLPGPARRPFDGHADGAADSLSRMSHLDADHNRTRRRKRAWKKLMWVKQSYPDNYTDQATFLENLQRNPRLKPYDFWPLVSDSTVILQHVCSVIIFIVSFVGIFQERVSPVSVVSWSSFATALGWLLWEQWVAEEDENADVSSGPSTVLARTGSARRRGRAGSVRWPFHPPRSEDVASPPPTAVNSAASSSSNLHGVPRPPHSGSSNSLNSQANNAALRASPKTGPVAVSTPEPPPAPPEENRVHTRLETIKSALLIYSTLLGLSPILKSLTRSTSSDSIWAMSFWLLAINIFFFDYSGGVGAKFPASLSTNAALMASTMLASRLPSTKQVFSLTLFSIEVFGLFPVFRRHVRHRSWQYNVALSVLLVLGSGLGVGIVLGDAQADRWPWKNGIVGMVVGMMLAALAAGGCSWWLIGLQKYKNEIRGPWDPARPIIMSRTRWDDR
ncbi:hypothetical protein HIM_04711 [Hirsutella minnesotensis 3608]|uniref:GPI2-domain-containing protein n=1 Tax=Hirsutella minnesotensis 3608 TaxID=1043627 RepID=A0A0F8A153_9HYPO|nr:hypothetical protein HIM_04711 [Hirsutella minnesotensis 3608]